MPKVTITDDFIYIDGIRAGEIDHSYGDVVVFLADRRYEADVRAALQDRFGGREIEFIL